MDNSSSVAWLQSKYLNFLAIFYAITQVTTIILAYRLIKMGPLVEPGGILIFPLGYIIGDIIAEIYGYRISKQVIWATFFGICIFSVMCTFIIHFPQPNYWHKNFAYEQVLGVSVRASVAQIIGVTFGAFINVYAISKWKILLKGKHFWLRSIGANAIGEAVTSIVIAIVLFIGKLNYPHLLNIILNMYLMKMFYVFLIAPVAWATVIFLKTQEGILYQNNFNPFKSVQ